MRAPALPLAPGVAGSFLGGSLDPARATNPARYSLGADSEASRSSSSVVPRAAAGPGGGGMARPGGLGQGTGTGVGSRADSRERVRSECRGGRGKPWAPRGGGSGHPVQAALKVTSRRWWRRRRHLGLAAGLGGGGAGPGVAGAGRSAGGRTGLRAAPGGRGR